MNKKLTLLFGIAFLVLTFAFVMAESTSTYCAEKTTFDSESNGAWCQPVVNIGDCNSSFKCHSTGCESTDYCGLGTCVDISEGECYKNKAKRICEEEEGVHYEESIEELPQCEEGCCFFGDSTDLMTGIKCAKLETIQGIETLFEPSITDYFECIDAGNPDVLGACTFERDFQTDCEMLTKENCQNLMASDSTAKFNEGFLCSAPKLLTKCGPSQKTECDVEEDKIYFLDTCDNRANIYDATKHPENIGDWQDYWTKIEKPEDSCVLDLDSNQLTCGNCEYSEGSTCAEYERGKQGFPNVGPEFGDYVCKNINCPWIERNHGESWCISNAIETGLENSPGSNWAVQKCYNGEIITEPCESGMREKICYESITESTSFAGCKENRWKDCIEQRDKDSCENIDDRDCRWIQVESEENRGFFIWEGDMPVGDKYVKPSSLNAEYTKGYCVPKNTSGSTFWDLDEEENVCAQVKIGGYGYLKNYWEYNFEIVWGKEIYESLIPYDVDDGEPWGLNLKKNSNWQIKMEDICSSVGDCNVKYNFLNVKGEDDSKTIFDISNWNHWRDWDWLWGWQHEENDLVEQKKITLVTCQPWAPPKGWDDCEKCNNQKDFPCTEYQCKSLGGRCEFETDVNTGNGYCYDKDPQGVKPPIITLLPEYLTDGFEFKPEDISSPPDHAVEIIHEIGENDCVPANKRFSFKIHTNKLAECKFNTIRTPSFEEMGDNWFDDSSGNRYNHSITLLPLGEIYEEQLYGMEVEPNRPYNIFVRCQGGNDIPNEPELVFNFCIDDAPDNQVPIILEADLENGAPIGYGVQNINVTFYLDEVADCKWDRLERNYEDMENEMFDCDWNTNHGNINVNGECTANFTGLTSNSNADKNDFYIRCRDRSPNNNTNSHSYPYTLYGSIPLMILPSYTNPTGALVGSSNEVEFEFNVKTAAGSENGLADCYYRKNTSSFFDRTLFGETGDVWHAQLYWRPLGIYNYTIECFDSAGNMATTQITFEVEQDTEEPIIVRAFADPPENPNFIKLITNEPAQCAYSTEDCTYSFADETITNITTIYTTEHLVVWDPEKDLFIKCKDKYNHYPFDYCSIELRASDYF